MDYMGKPLSLPSLMSILVSFDLSFFHWPSTEDSKIDLERQKNVAYKAHTIPTAQNAAYTAVQSSEGDDGGYVINQLESDKPNQLIYDEPRNMWTVMQYGWFRGEVSL